MDPNQSYDYVKVVSHRNVYVYTRRERIQDISIFYHPVADDKNNNYYNLLGHEKTLPRSPPD